MGWGNNVHAGVGWGIRHATLKMCHVTQGWGGVGWGNNVHVLAHSHDVMPRHVHLHVRTYVMLR